jgi:cytoskeletal protein RodZ
MLNRIAFAASAVLGLALASASLAQTPPPPKPTSEQDQPSQTRPDARYPNPSGQDSKPHETPPPKTQADRARAKQPTSNPRTADPSEDNGAGKDLYTGSRTGKKPSANTGCSTPTDAASAQGQTKQPASKSKPRETVCTTSGGDSAAHTKPQK